MGDGGLRYSVRENPEIIGSTITCDGEELRKVVALDAEEGWVELHCMDRHTGHPGASHLNPTAPDEVCTVVRRGAIRVTPAPRNSSMAGAAEKAADLMDELFA